MSRPPFCISADMDNELRYRADRGSMTVRIATNKNLTR